MISFLQHFAALLRDVCLFLAVNLVQARAKRFDHFSGNGLCMCR